MLVGSGSKGRPSQDLSARCGLPSCAGHLTARPAARQAGARAWFCPGCGVRVAQAHRTEIADGPDQGGARPTDRPGARAGRRRSGDQGRPLPERGDRRAGPGRHRDLRRLDRRHPRRLPRRARDRRRAAGSPCPASSTRTCTSRAAWSRRSSSSARCCRAAPPPRSAIRTRSRTCSGRTACATSSTPRSALRMTLARAAQLVRAGDRARDLRRAARCGRPASPLRDHPAVLGLAEMMNFPGVLARDDAVLDKLVAFAGWHVDGHAPLVRGYDLNAYLAAAIRTDHESTGFAEGREKLSKGMQRADARRQHRQGRRRARPAADRGHVAVRGVLHRRSQPARDRGRRATSTSPSARRSRGGVPPLVAYRAASCGAARAFGLFDRGQIAPGRRADIVLLDDLESCAVAQVICGGMPIDRRGIRRTRRGAAGRPWLGPAPAGRARAVRGARRRTLGPGDRRDRALAADRASEPGAAVPRRPAPARPGAGRAQAVRARAPRPRRHGRARLRQGLRRARRRARQLDRPRQPQSDRGRRRRRRHGARGQPADRAAGRLRRGRRRRGARRAGRCRSPG